MKKVILYMLILFSLRQVTAVKPLMSVILQRCTSYCNPEYCKIVTVCRPLNRTSKFVSMDIYVHPGITLKAPIYVEIVAFKKFTTVYRQHMLKLKGEICEHLLLKTHPLFRLQNGKPDSGNLLEPCPFSGHRYINVGISNLDYYVIPQVRLIPAGEWRLDFTVTRKRNGSEVVVVTWSDYYEIKPLTAEEF